MGLLSLRKQHPPIVRDAQLSLTLIGLNPGLNPHLHPSDLTPTPALQGGRGLLLSPFTEGAVSPEKRRQLPRAAQEELRLAANLLLLSLEAGHRTTVPCYHLLGTEASPHLLAAHPCPGQLTLAFVVASTLIQGLAIIPDPKTC